MSQKIGMLNPSNEAKAQGLIFPFMFISKSLYIDLLAGSHFSNYFSTTIPSAMYTSVSRLGC